MHAGDVIGEIALGTVMAADVVDIGKTIRPQPTLGKRIGRAARSARAMSQFQVAVAEVSATVCQATVEFLLLSSDPRSGS